MESLQLLLDVAAVLLLLIPLSTTAIPSATLQAATEILSTSGHLSMSLTLQLVSHTILPHSPSLTIFSPNDAAFAMYGQPSLSLLQYHFSPLSFTPHSLFLLPPLTPIPTLLPNKSLTVSPREDSVYVNGIKLSDAPLFNDGDLVVYSIDKFLDPNYNSFGGCRSGASAAASSSFEGAIRALKGKEYSQMSAFLGMQMLGYMNGSEFQMTVFAPMDDEEKVSDWSRLMRHIVGCRVTWTELDSVEDGVEMRSYVNGYVVRLGRSGDIVLLNEVPVAYPDLYTSDSIVVHGLRGSFEDAAASTAQGDVPSYVDIVLDEDDEF